MIHAERIRRLNRRPVRPGRYVLYWMQASQRAACNHALQFAVARANELGQPVVAAFGLTDDYPEANARHYAFMLEGLAETDQALRRQGVQLVARRGEPDRVAAELAGEASLAVADAGYLRHQRRWRRAFGRAVECAAWQVESDLVVPVQAASDHAEYAARTIRPKLHRCWETFLRPLTEARPRKDSLALRLGGLDLQQPAALLEGLKIDRSVAPVAAFRGGLSQARRRLGRFIRETLNDYADLRSDPGLDVQSHMSAYLHFGQISPLEIALRIRSADHAAKRAREAYLEELLVRRELSANFVYYTRRYDSFACLPRWARRTLCDRRGDRREYRYSLAELEQARTHDPYWNAAMTEMRRTGLMHNYMRMYWGKKILEWTGSPATAFRWALRLNNKYFLDGRDPASYANVAWLFGLHDRPWTPRPIYGAVRAMTAAGLERKFDMQAYVRKVERLG